MEKTLKRGLFFVFAMALILGPGAQWALADDNYPSKPVDLVVGYKAGGQIDTTARVLAKSLGDVLGQPVVVVNKGGAGGRLAINMIKNAKPDGYTLCNTVATPYTFFPHIRELKYTINDFQYVAAFGKLIHMSVVSLPDKPWKDFKGLIAYAKKNPGMTWASVSPVDQTALKYIGKMEGIKWSPVPVKGGAGMVRDLLGGHVDFGFSGGIHHSYVKAGKMRVLALFGSERVPQYPDVPTLQQLGYKIILDNYNIVTAPLGIKKPVLDKLADAFSKATKDPKYVDVIENKFKNKSAFLGPLELKQYIESQSQGTKEITDQLK